MVTEELRKEISADAAVILQHASSIKMALSDGLQPMSDVPTILGSFMALMPIITKLTAASNEVRAVYGEELFDAATGTDATALLKIDLPGLDPAAEEALYDSMKKLAGGLVVSKLLTVPSE